MPDPVSDEAVGAVARELGHLYGYESTQGDIGFREGRARRLIEAALPFLRPSPREPSEEAWELARRFHEAYERLAPEHGYKTREESAVPWEDVPAGNKALMVATCVELLPFLRAAYAVDNPYGSQSLSDDEISELLAWSKPTQDMDCPEPLYLARAKLMGELGRRSAAASALADNPGTEPKKPLPTADDVRGILKGYGEEIPPGRHHEPGACPWCSDCDHYAAQSHGEKA